MQHSITVDVYRATYGFGGQSLLKCTRCGDLIITRFPQEGEPHYLAVYPNGFSKCDGATEHPQSPEGWTVL